MGKNSKHKLHSKSLPFFLAAGLAFAPLGARAASPMQVPPSIYPLQQQVGDQVVEGSYPATLQIGNFDTGANSTDAIGNAFNEIAVVGTTDTFVESINAGGPIPGDGYANIWSVIHNGAADPSSLSPVDPLNLLIGARGPGGQYPQALQLLDLTGDGVDDLNFLGGKGLGACDSTDSYGDECSVLSVVNSNPNSAPFFDGNSLDAISNTEGQLFGIPVGPAFTQGILQVLGGSSLLSGTALQSNADYQGDGDTDIFYYDYEVVIPQGTLTPALTGPSIVVLQNDGVGAFTANTFEINLDNLIESNFRAINSGDFNGDGTADVALLFAGISIADLISGPPAPPFAPNKLLIFYGNADGSFGTGGSPATANVTVDLAQSLTDIPSLTPPFTVVGHFVHTLANGDFDGDGTQDFVVGTIGLSVDIDGDPAGPTVTNIFVSSAPYNHIVTCSAGGCADEPVLASTFLNLIVRNAVADFNSDGLDDIATATISPGLLGLILPVLPSNNDSEVRLFLNQGGATFTEPEDADQVFQVPVANIIDPDSGTSLGGFSYGISDLVAGNIDNCGGPDLAYSTFVCPTAFDISNPDTNINQVCFPGLLPLLTGTPSKAININDNDATTPGAVSVVLNEITPPVVTPIVSDVVSDNSISLSTTCTTDGDEASQITWALETPVAGVSIQNADQANATLVTNGSTGGNVTVIVTCADACNSVSTSTTLNLTALLQGSGTCSLGAMAGNPAGFSIFGLMLLGLVGRRLLKK